MNKSVLIIDDEELIIKSLTKLLNRDGLKVVVARNGDDAIHIAKTTIFDLIISDVRMPGLNGVETVKIIYENLLKEGIHKTPVIFITGYAHDDSEKEARSLNPTSYIYKPFNIVDLMTQVKKVLS
jgi:CheY-like chemotaxis protein